MKRTWAKLNLSDKLRFVIMQQEVFVLRYLFVTVCAVIALFIVSFSHLHYNVIQRDTRQFLAKPTK